MCSCVLSLILLGVATTVLTAPPQHRATAVERASTTVLGGILNAYPKKAGKYRNPNYSNPDYEGEEDYRPPYRPQGGYPYQRPRPRPRPGSGSGAASSASASASSGSFSGDDLGHGGGSNSNAQAQSNSATLGVGPYSASISNSQASSNTGAHTGGYRGRPGGYYEY